MGEHKLRMFFFYFSSVVITLRNVYPYCTSCVCTMLITLSTGKGQQLLFKRKSEERMPFILPPQRSFTNMDIWKM